jgi:hypothetical protein
MNFEPSDILAYVLITGLSEESMFSVVRRLLDMGAQVDPTCLDNFCHMANFDETKQLLREYRALQVEGEEVKEPDMD